MRNPFSRTLAKLRETITQSTTAFREELDAKARDVEALEAEVATLAHGNLSADELHTVIADVVQTAGAKWLRDHAHELVSMPTGRTKPVGASTRLASVHGRVVAISGKLTDLQLHSWPAMCAADPEGAANYLRALADAAGYAPGLSAADRARRLAEVNADIERLTAEHEALADEAVDAGVTVDHLPSVVTRRAEEARRREDVAAERKRAEKQQAQLDARYPAPGQFSSASAYLRTGRLGDDRVGQ
jgi:hypothetical protein